MSETTHFSKEWESEYRSGRQLNYWPWSDLVSFVHRHVPGREKPLKVLELGCGSGANIPFFLDLGAGYHAVDGSRYMVDLLINRYPALKGRIKQADFTDRIPFDMKFDLIFDRAGLTHNNTRGIQKAIALVEKRLEKDGVFIGVDWLSSRHGDIRFGRGVDDPHTFTGFSKGQLENVGKVHFSDEVHLKSLFKQFDFLSLEHKLTEVILPDSDTVRASWNFAVRLKEL